MNDEAYCIPAHAMTQEYRDLFDQAVAANLKGVNTRWRLETLREKLAEKDQTSTEPQVYQGSDGSSFQTKQ